MQAIGDWQVSCSVTVFFAGQSAVATVGNTTVASGKYCHSSKHGALEYKSANIKQASAPPPVPNSSIPLLLALFLYCDPPRATSFHRRSLTAKRKRREELWAPPPPEYRKLLRLKAQHQSAGYSTPLYEERLRASLAGVGTATFGGKNTWPGGAGQPYIIGIIDPALRAYTGYRVL